MRRKRKKTIAFTLTLLLFVSVICSRGLFASAESMGFSETETDIQVEEVMEKPVETLSEQTQDPEFEESELKETSSEETEMGETMLEETSSEEPVPDETVQEVEEKSQTITNDTYSDEESAETEIADSLEEQSVTYEPSSLPDGISGVKAIAEGRAFEDGTVLTAKLVSEDTEDYQTISDILQEENIEFDGFKVLDLSFLNAEGEEIEPVDCTVQVRFDMDRALFPEETDLDSLTVWHLAKTEEGIRVEEAADGAGVNGGMISVDGDVIKADFTVDSFSAFAVTYSNILLDTFAVNSAAVYSSAAEQMLTVTKQWKTTGGTIVDNEHIPFGKVEVDIDQYYRVGTYPNLEEKIIDQDNLVLTKDNSWTDTYNDGVAVAEYSLFRATAERVYSNDGKLIADFTCNSGNWEVTYGEGYNESDLKGWSIDSFKFSRDYGTAQTDLNGRVQSCANVTIEVPGNGLALVKLTSGSGYIIWMPYLDNIDASMREAIKAAVVADNPPGTGNISTDNIQFYDEVPGSMTGVTIDYLVSGDISIHMDAKSAWAQVWYGPFQFNSDIISASLVNTLDTSITTDLTVTKIWDDDNNKLNIRPSELHMDVNSETVTQESVVLSKDDPNTIKSTDGNIWSKTVSVPKYNSGGIPVEYTIEEENLEDYTPTYDQSNLTVTNRLKNVCLTVEKIVDGNMGDKDQSFTFTMTLMKGDQPYTNPISYGTDGKELSAQNGVYTFELKHAEKITLNVPYGCTYSVKEDKPSDYQLTITGDNEGTITENKTVIFTNTKHMIAPTGISHIVLPYIMMVIVAIQALVCFCMIYVRKKRY